MMKKIVILLALPLALAGCSSAITNLTSGRLPRSSDGTYRVEAAWQTTERTIRPETIKPSVLVGLQSYPMQPEPVVNGRWEAFVPVAADQNLVHYQFRFDFMRDEIPAQVPDNRISETYSLQIVDKPADGK